jgi:hypothetical protein
MRTEGSELYSEVQLVLREYRATQCALPALSYGPVAVPSD